MQAEAANAARATNSCRQSTPDSAKAKRADARAGD
jgi:hypothetical protein